MKKAFFYLIEDEAFKQASSHSPLSAMEYGACQQIIHEWQTQRSRILVACEDQKQAENIDEFLWQLDTRTFIPHNLAGEGLKEGAPVELCWPECRSHSPRQLLINLQPQYSDYMLVFNHIIDFVPHDEHLKQLARERYQYLKRNHFNIKTLPSLITV